MANATKIIFNWSRETIMLYLKYTGYHNSFLLLRNEAHLKKFMFEMEKKENEYKSYCKRGAVTFNKYRVAYTQARYLLKRIK